MGYYILINNIYGKNPFNSSPTLAKAIYKGNKKVYRIMKGGRPVFDAWETVFQASSFQLPSSGGNVEDFANVLSYGTDYKGDRHEMAYTFYPVYIPANSTSSMVTGSVTVTQTDTGETITISYAQSAS